MSTPPAVSVIIPAYNSARYLAATLRSVLEQTFTEFEVIVVDDGSADDSVAVVRQCDDRRVRLIEHGRNLGVQQARNTGIRAARGEVLAFLDSDDLFHQDKLQAHMSLRGARPDVGFTYNARFALHYSSEKIRGLWRPPAALALSDVLLGFPMAPSDMVVTKRWASEVGLWDEELFFYGGAAARRAFNGAFTINRACASYLGERYREVPARVMRAVARDPRYLLNRGVLSILVRSLAGLGRAG